MSKRRRRTEKWEYPSLEWIHKVRETLVREERGVPLTRPRGPSPVAAEMMARLRLKALRASRLGRRNRRKA
ncbi:MAG: hypothetical protein ACREIU_12200 [Planctomycetota bacterium]